MAVRDHHPLPPYDRLMAVVDHDLAEAGRRALRRHGWQALTAERIAEEAGISRVTLHRRGVKKEDILEALTAQAIEAYRAAMWPALTAAGNARQRLELALGALCDSAEENLDLLVALRSQTDAIFHDPDEGEVMTRDVFTEPLERLLRDGISDGSIRRVNPLETATVLFNLVGWTYVHLRTGHRWRPQRARRRVVDLALHGLLSQRAAG
jgi:AcrR family transcriptional regulator